MKNIIKWLLVFLIVLIVVGLVVYIKEEKDIRQETILNQNHLKPKVVPNNHYDNKIIFINLDTHTKKKKKLAQNITLKGNYTKLGFIVGNYSSGSATLDLTEKSAKVTCPNDFVIFPNVGITNLGSQTETHKCNKQGGCDAFFVMYINGTGFFAQTRNQAKNSAISLVKNDEDGVGAVCVKEDQIKDWR